ncbi:ornithine cyclodeaminase/mu-crystallin family protein [Hyphomonas neptunium ATCC 15444]|uniref:Ornithine cyclodeaminase/mu-crystallin family protein n=2 Tax=Hyphomonas TaxID=85 RepID=Q0BZ13_HYPNA|nr:MULTISPECIES: ornithine cyclodeaminase family protein [Hyphomonas]ABI77404.1 ornithine cyclodeaminase/mu-crystallin family protein [Hyphomonas neptunium ATCC 15444]KCZ87276.1 ornithine cyclodeaminase/mu-crystallin family protein [Hyphomonas hirschiana VP5]
MIFIGADEIRQTLSYTSCIEVMRTAMARLSAGKTQQMLRQILPLEAGRMFGIMGGTLGPGGPFGSKLVSVMPHRAEGGPSSHQGAVVIFDPDSGAPLCQLEAGMLTAIRTASASAMATDVLAREGAHTLAILGTGEQAWHHACALPAVRPFDEIRIWGRSRDRADALADKVRKQTGIVCAAYSDVAESVAGADVICTVTGAADPLLDAAMVSPGTHLNVVGSSFDGPREIDDTLVSAARYFADSRASVLAQGSEIRHAIASGAVTEAHLLGEIGEVVLGKVAGRMTPDNITLYKSLGHIVQDIASGYHVYQMIHGRHSG